ncbi:hypothetical protein KFK09_028385 [Dendrobium nobile]|uniref:Uncharacterized protein n=1 Tax=Dendrobium nobile TaxID=94219 RepID=A0A8T3A381_DENNO|nr:hypothetical protein KFK09_028385 [Dendrobium nobile]
MLLISLTHLALAEASMSATSQTPRPSVTVDLSPVNLLKYLTESLFPSIQYPSRNHIRSEGPVTASDFP